MCLQTMWQDLAPELIFEILSYFLPDLRLAVCQPNSFPWYLGHICSTWRCVFTTSPQFWSLIKADFSNNRALSSGNSTSTTEDALAVAQRAATLVQFCLDRGKDYPLLFEFITGTSKDSCNRDHASQCQPPPYINILDMLVTHSARWREARVIVNARDLPALHKAKGCFPQLHALQLLVTDGAGPPIPDLFGHAPCLSHVSLSNLSAWHVDWSTLKAIEIHTPGATRFQEIIGALRETKCLEKLVLHQPFDISLMLNNITPVTLPSLTVLYTDGAVVLPFIKAPALQFLWVQNGYNNFEKYYTQRAFHAHISAFFEPLRHLQFFMLAPWDTKDARIFLQCMPRVDRLCFVTRLVNVLECLTTACPNAPYLREFSLQLTDFRPQALKAAEPILTTLVKDIQKGIQKIDVVSTTALKVADPLHYNRDINNSLPLPPSFAELKLLCETLEIQLSTASPVYADVDALLVGTFYSDIITV